MKEIKLFVDFEFTSLSPDAQPISVGIVSETTKKAKYPVVSVQTKEPFKEKPIETDIGIDALGRLCMNTHGEFLLDESETKSFYAEFTDFDISRCDDWVKENVVSKLHVGRRFNKPNRCINTYNWECSGNIESSKFLLNEWLKQFSDYKIQFVVDCGIWDWYWMLQLLAEWDVIENEEAFSGKCPTCGQSAVLNYKRGLPKLSDNISPVPMDLNDLIAFKKGISVSEAFDLNREQLAFGRTELSENEKHNALWDAKVIKAIYEQLNS